MENRKFRFTILFPIISIVFGIVSSCAFNNLPGSETIQPVRTQTPEKTETIQTEAPIMKETDQPEMNTLILEIPVIEYEDGNQLTEPIITGYDQNIIKEGEEFILDPAALGFLLGQSVGAVKLKLVLINPDSITIDILADTLFDGEFHPRDPIERIEIKDGTCIDTVPLVMDVFYQYCFELDSSGSQITLRYSIEEESTMPAP